MTSYVPVIKNGANGAIFYVGLIDQSNTKLLKASPTLATGDFKVSIDGGALNNLGTLPTVTPAAGRMVKITLAQSEVNGDNITVVCVDAAGAEWCDLLINIQTTARQIDDLAFPATSGRSMVVDASGLVDANAVKIGPTGSGSAQTARDIGASVLLAAAQKVDVDTIKTNPVVNGGTITFPSNATVATTTGAVGSVTGAVGSVTGAVGSVTGAVGSVTGAVGSVTGNVGGNVVGSVASVAGNVVGSVGSVTGAVGSVTGAVGSVTGNVGGNVVGSVASLTANNDKTGYRLSATGVGDILTTALTESYAADGAAPTLSQALFAVQQFLQEKGIVSTTLTVNKLDGTTPAMTFTLDSATAPTSITRAT